MLLCLFGAVGRDSGSDREMAGISFLDLLFAEAIASGMAREARTRERPPPDNFFVLPRDPRAWLQIQAASKKENMVIAVEITDDSNESCLRMQRLFMDMAREHDGMPFLRVKIGLGCTFDQVATFYATASSCVAISLVFMQRKTRPVSGSMLVY